MAAAAERTAKRRRKRPSRAAAAARANKPTAAEQEPRILAEAPPAPAESSLADEPGAVQQPGIVPGLAVALVGIMAWLVFGFWAAAVILCAAAVVAVLGTMIRF